MTTVDQWAEWKEGYRDGMQTCVTVAQTCAAEPEATAQDVLTLLEVLMESSVIQPDPGGRTFHVEPPTNPIVPEPWHPAEDCGAPPGQCLMHPPSN